MNDLQSLFGNVLAGPWANAQASQPTYDAIAAQNAYLAQPYLAAPAPDPEVLRQQEIKAKNARNYSRWQSRILRDPLTDCVAV